MEDKNEHTLHQPADYGQRPSEDKAPPEGFFLDLIDGVWCLVDERNNDAGATIDDAFPDAREILLTLAQETAAARALEGGQAEEDKHADAADDADDYNLHRWSEVYP